ncbi:YolD-like family protein [Paenibacillus camelliae]|uniref:YolD-like family protein n=1 Tax=Paenibacillus camelliae TaxID=512410 RepID=UPI00203D21A6|nr:YolD-like family protein [Paenibacillus camelliae]MCM3632105.1 YolD-like family protein [Paenibacillus camelliae]
MSKKLQGNGLFESSRMMLPEHKEAIVNYQLALNKKQRPVLDEQRFEELSYRMFEALYKNLEVAITVFHPYMDTVITGMITKIDTQLKRVKVVSEGGDEELWISFSDLLDIDAAAAPS